MLKILRDNLRYLSWILWLVILVFVAFVFVDFGGARFGGRESGAAATVGDDQVTYAEFQRQHRNLDERYRRALGERYSPEMAKQLQLPLQALEQLVGQKILLQEAERLGLAASDAEVREAILEQPYFRDESGAFVGQEYYQQVLAAEGFTVGEFERTVREQIQVSKLNAILAQSLHVSDQEVERAYREGAERVRVRYLTVPAARFAAQVTVGPDDLAPYFAAHRADFRLPRQRVVAYLLVDSARLRGQQQLERAELEKYYTDHPDEFRQEEQVRARHLLVAVGAERTEAQARTEVEELRARLAAGADFAELARERSDDPGSKPRGGDLGFFGRGRMVREFEEAAFSARTGELVGPLRTSFGFHLLEVVERRPAGLRPLAEAEPQIRARLLGERVEQIAEAKARELARKVQEGKVASQEQLQALADNETVVWQVTPPFGEDDSVAGIGRGTPFTTAAFGLEPGKVSDPVKIPRGWALLWLVEEREPRDPELAEVEPRVRQAVVRERQIDLARAEAARVRAAVAAGRSLTEVATDLGLAPTESPDLAAGADLPGLPGSQGVADAALALEVGQLGGPLPVANGAVVFEVLSRSRFDPARFAQEKEAKREEIEAREYEAVIASLIAQRKLDLKVSYDRPLLEELGLAGGPEEGK